MDITERTALIGGFGEEHSPQKPQTQFKLL